MVAILLPRDQLWHQLSSVVTQTIIVNSNGVQLFNEKSHQASKIACDASNKSPTSIFSISQFSIFLPEKELTKVFRKCLQIVKKNYKNERWNHHYDTSFSFYYKLQRWNHHYELYFAHFNVKVILNHCVTVMKRILVNNEVHYTFVE